MSRRDRAKRAVSSLPDGRGEEPAARSTDKPRDDSRCAFIALIGAPNVGKSTLVNALVGSKVSIVTHKVQTTRSLVRGVAIAGPVQLVLIDTPGIFAPRRRLDRAMVATAWAGARDADVVGVLIDAKRGLDDEAGVILSRLAEVRRPKVLIIN
jgi:GTP-binding protein Era